MVQVFLKYYHYEALCHLLSAHLQHVVAAQACCRGWLQRRKYQQELKTARAATVVIQKGS